MDFLLGHKLRVTTLHEKINQSAPPERVLRFTIFGDAPLYPQYAPCN